MKPTDRRQWYTIRNAAATTDSPPEILIYGEIDSWFGVDAAQFVKDLATIDAPEILVRINSPGGDIFDGVAILNALRGHDARIITQVDSLAASAASVVAMAGDEIIMNANSQMMLHNAWALVVGNSDDMQQAADMLERQNDNIASVYAQRAGGTAEDWRAVMNEETWMTAQEAVDAGLADRVITLEPKASTAAAQAAASFDRSRFRYAGRQSAPAPKIAARLHSTHHDEEATMTPGKPKFSRHDNEQVVDAAIADGKIMASDRPKWLGRMQQDPHGFRSLLGALASHPVECLTPTQSTSANRDAAEDAEMAATFAKVAGRPAPEFQRAHSNPQAPSPAARTPSRPTRASAAVKTPAPADWGSPRATPVAFNSSGQPTQELVEYGRPPSEWTAREQEDAAQWALGDPFRAGLQPPPEYGGYIRDLTQPHIVQNSDGSYGWHKTDPYA